LSILNTQKRLAEITEMIHTASLLHDDVIDESMVRRSQPSANAAFGNKMAILAGDFLLARASIALARLRNVQVVELLATVISNLVEGEFMQLRNTGMNHYQYSSELKSSWTVLNSIHNAKLRNAFSYYLEKTYMKTASLIAKSCEASAVLGGCNPKVVGIAYEFGKNLGLAFQVRTLIFSFLICSICFCSPHIPPYLFNPLYLIGMPFTWRYLKSNLSPFFLFSFFFSLLMI